MRSKFPVLDLALIFLVFVKFIDAFEFEVYAEKCKECYDYQGKPDYLSLLNLPHLVEKACTDNETANDLYDHFLHSCSLECRSPYPAWVSTPSITPKEYCAQIQFEGQAEEAIIERYPFGDIDRGVVNVTYEVKHRLCFSMQGNLYKYFEGRPRASGKLTEACWRYIKHIPNVDRPGTLSSSRGISISPDDPKLREAMPYMTMSIFLCTYEGCDRDYGNKILCHTDKAESGNKEC